MGGAMTWVSERSLVSAISEAGGFGVLACGSMGPEQLAEEIAATRRLTARPFGVNLIVLHPELRQLVDACLDLRVGHVVLAGGLPQGAVMRRLRAGGAKVVCFAPSLGVARKLARGGADALVIEGMEAGGHIGAVSTSVLAQEILPHLGEEGDPPVFVAGGIGHGEMVAAYLNMGAPACRWAPPSSAPRSPWRTRPSSRPSCAPRPATRSLGAGRPGVQVIPVRAIANAGTRRFAEIQVEVIGRYRRGEISQEEASLAIERYWAGALRRAVVEGDVEHGSLMAGQSVGSSRRSGPRPRSWPSWSGRRRRPWRGSRAAAAAAPSPRPPRGRVAAMPAGGGRVAPEPPTEMRPELSGSRRLLRRLVDVVAEPVAPQQRLDRIVSIVAANLVAEVCSVYFHRAGDVLELFATEGLAKEAVHLTRMRVGEGLVGTIAAQGAVINTADARNHPNFRYFPETGEEVYHSFLGVPILREGRVVGVLTVQNRARKLYAEERSRRRRSSPRSSPGSSPRASWSTRPSTPTSPGIGRETRRLEGMRSSRAWPSAGLGRTSPGSR
jgi:enoyl-[acyl-carrier protein] reductase II